MPEVPVVVVGAGLAGLATAVAAARRGHRVTILEKTTQVGGAASYSGGQAWIAANHLQRAQGLEDSIEDGARYVRALGADHPELIDTSALDRWLSQAPRAAEYFEQVGAVTWSLIPDYPDYYQDAPGARSTGRYLTASYDARKLGDWRDRLRVSPHFPVGTTYSELLGAGLRASAFGTAPEAGEIRRSDLLTFGTGVVGGFLTSALEHHVDIRLEHDVVDLECDDGGRVVGVISRTPEGHPERFPGAVVLATSGYDWDDDLSMRYLGLKPEDRGSVAPTSVSGDGIRLAQRAGGTITEIPRNRVPIQLGYPTDHEPGYAVAREHSLPHTFIVDRNGKRFADDAVYWEVVKHVLDPKTLRLPCWMIWDEQHHQKYGLGSTAPGAQYPPGLVESAGSLQELGVRLGINGQQLAETAHRFNSAAAAGVDPEFGRGSNLTWQKFQGDPKQEPHPNLGPVDHAPFYGMRLRMISTGIGLTGISVDSDGRVLDDAKVPIHGLYAAGAAAAFNSSGAAYNSGFSLSRAITLGWLVAERIAHDLPGSR
jgi:3-oxosteroid 1-dehydrogenase